MIPKIEKLKTILIVSLLLFSIFGGMLYFAFFRVISGPCDSEVLRRWSATNDVLTVELVAVDCGATTATSFQLFSVDKGKRASEPFFVGAPRRDDYRSNSEIAGEFAIRKLSHESLVMEYPSMKVFRLENTDARTGTKFEYFSH